MSVQFRQMPNEAFEAIVCQEALWQFSQSDYSIPVSNGVTISCGTTNVAVPDFPQVKLIVDMSTPASDNIVWDSSMMAILEGFDEAFRKIQFEELRREWLRTRNAVSSIHGDVSRNPAYYRIVGMGPSIIPLILEHLKNELEQGMPDHWFAALWAISGGENPVPDADQGRIRKMAEAWLKWGEQRGYLNAEVGAIVS